MSTRLLCMPATHGCGGAKAASQLYRLIRFPSSTPCHQQTMPEDLPKHDKFHQLHVLCNLHMSKRPMMHNGMATSKSTVQ